MTAAAAILLATVGAFGRAFADRILLFFILKIVAQLGMSSGNVAGAPLAKKISPTAKGTLLTVFALQMQLGIYQLVTRRLAVGTSLFYAMAFVTPLIAARLKQVFQLATAPSR